MARETSDADDRPRDVLLLVQSMDVIWFNEQSLRP